MSRWPQVLMPGLLWVLLAGSAAGDLIPTPEFGNHAIPTVAMPNAKDQVWPVLDVAVLLLALALSSYAILIARSRRYVLVLTVASLLWFGFYRQGCICPIGATQNVALAMSDSDYVIPMTAVAFFVLPLFFTLLFGRTFCASVCPLGAVQELLAVRPVSVPRWLDHSLGLLAYVYLGAALIFAASGTAFIICRYDPFVALFRLSGNLDMIIFGGSMLVLSVLIGRPYCRYLCPYGAVLRLLGSLSKWRLSIPPETCITCRLCEDVCPYGAIHPPTVEQGEAGRHSGRRRLLLVLLVAPLVIAGLTLAGRTLAVPLSLWHPTVRLAEQVRMQQQGLALETTDAADAFAASGEAPIDLYADALGLRDRFRFLGGLLGAWAGVVVGVKLIHLSIRRRREDYQADRSGCVSCGRCYWYCPVEQVRLGLIDDVSEVVPEAKT